MADELPYNAWDPFRLFSSSGKVKKKPKLPVTMANVLAGIPEYEETGDHDRIPVESGNANRPLSQKRLNESFGDVLARQNARTNSPAVQFIRGVPASRYYGGIQELPTGGYLNPHAIAEIPEKFKTQYAPTNAQIAGDVSAAVASSIPGGQIANLIRVAAGQYHGSQEELDKRRLNYAYGGPIIPGFNALDDGTGSSSSIGFTPPEAQRNAQIRATMADALRKRDAAREFVHEDDFTFGGGANNPAGNVPLSNTPRVYNETEYGPTGVGSGSIYDPRPMPTVQNFNYAPVESALDPRHLNLWGGGLPVSAQTTVNSVPRSDIAPPSTAFAPAVKFNNFGQMVPASGRDEVEEDPVGNWGGGPADIM
tara:strand:+ start:573 stop:1670 length:1098 start_codon:yes stop_codon:yes gene_type:complete